jgi:hypothetical protein
MAIKKKLPTNDYLGIEAITGPEDTATPAGRAADDYLGIGTLGGPETRPAPEARQASDYLGVGTLGGTRTGIAVDPVTASTTSANPVKPKLVSTYTDDETGDIIDVYEDGTEQVRRKGRVKLDKAAAADALAAERLAERESAYDILYSQFKDLGLESLVSDIRDSIIKSQSQSERILALRSSNAYKLRFGANDKRLKNGFRAIDEATYLALEDKYQSILQNYGMPAKYYTRGELGVQQYLADAISKNIDPVTFEEKIIEGKKLLNANKATIDAAKQIFPMLNDSDFLDYVLNPENAIEDIKRKVSAAEIGGAQLGAGLQMSAAAAQELAKVTTGEKYQKVASDIAAGTIRGGQLAGFYGQDPYTQQTAEQVALNLPGSAKAIQQTEKIAGLEGASFRAKSGLTGGALARDRAGGI